MNQDRMEGRWKQLKGRLKEKWGHFTDDELDRLEGRWDQMAGLIQQRYGIARDEAARQLSEFRTEYERDEAGVDR
jgi:uncharacterized protein YjbJ (UPF0337 family)